jgi:hypothetical protein
MILRTLDRFLKGSMADLEELAKESRDAGDDAAAEDALQQLQSIMRLQFTSEEEELDEVVILEEEEVAPVTAAASAPGIAADSALAPGTRRRTFWKRRASTHT